MITLFLPSLAGGGAEVVMLRLAAQFREWDQEVELVVGEASGPLASQVPPGLRVVPLGATRIRASVRPLIRYLKLRRPAAMLTAMDHTNIAGLLAARLSGVPVRVVPSVHVAFAPAFLEEQGRSGAAVNLFARLLYPGASAVVAVSQGVADSLVKVLGLSRDKITVIPNPLVTPGLAAQAREPAGHPWLDQRDVPVILGIGRLAPQKDFGTLLEAFATLHAYKPARLVILGEGPERGRLEARVRELGLSGSVALPGFVANPFAYMARASLVVMSSIYEGFGNVLVEAMACGTPVVSTDCPSGPAEILEQGRYGRLVAPRDPGALAMALITSLEAPLQPERLRARAEAYRADRIAARYAPLLGIAVPPWAGERRPATASGQGG